MLNESVRQLEEAKDIKNQQENDQFISNYRVEAINNGILELERREKVHTELLTRIDDDLIASLAKLCKEREKIEKDFEEKQKQLMESMQKVIEQKTGSYDAVTTTALASLEERTRKVEEEIRLLEKERVEMEEKWKGMKVEQSTKRFDEGEAKREKQDKDNEAMEKELQQMEVENQNELLKNVQENRAHANESTGALVSQIRKDAQNQLSLGLATVGINESANDRKNRAFINEKFRKVRDSAAICFNTYYGRAYGVLSMEPAEMAGLAKGKIRETTTALSQFNESLQKIRVELDDIDQLLAGLSLKGVDKANEIREIKTKISEFAQVIFPIKAKLGALTDKSGVKPELIEKFTTLKDELNKMIIAIATIDEARGELDLAIKNALPAGTSSENGAAVKAIQN